MIIISIIIMALTASSLQPGRHHPQLSKSPSGISSSPCLDLRCLQKGDDNDDSDDNKDE